MNAIFVDFKLPLNWCFLPILETQTEEKWDAIESQTNQYHGGKIAAMVRFFWYFFFPLQMVMKRTKWNRIIAWQQFYGINFAFWCRLFHLKKKNNLTVMTFIYKRKAGLKGKLYHKYMSFAVRSKYIDRFICFSKEESLYYPKVFGVDKSKFVYIPVGIAPLSDIETSDEGYIFATGRSNRDYDFLLNVLKGTDYQCQIACDTLSDSLSGGTTILSDCHGEDMIKMMARSHCVVIPLKDVKVSSGQLVILQAMALGKPVICTDADGIRDYTTKDTAIMVDNNVDFWREAIRTLYQDNNRYNDMSKAAKSLFEKYFTDVAMYYKIGKIIIEHERI